MNLRVVRKSRKELSAIAAERVEFTSRYNESMFDSDWEKLRDALRRRLSKNWNEDGEGVQDFAISDDRANVWMQCGGIYSKEALCLAFPAAISEVLMASKFPERWGFDCVIELWVNDRSQPLDRDGQFLVKNGVLYVPDDDTCDYTSLLK